MNHFDLESESAVLGAMFYLDDLKLNEVSLYLKSDMFYDPRNALIFHSMDELIKEEKPIDTITISDKLKQKEMYEKVGIDYILEIYTGCSTFENVMYYCRSVKDMYIRRKVLRFGQQLQGIDPYQDIEEIVTQFENKKDEIFNDLDADEVRSLGDDVIEELEKPAPVKLFETGLVDLDEYISLESASILEIGGDPGVGKSSFALNLALKAAQNNKVLFVSLEMKARKLYDRLVAIKTQKNLDFEINQDKDRICWSELYNVKNIYFDYGNLDTVEKIAIRNFKLKANVIIIDNNMLLDTGVQNPEQHHMKIVKDIKKKLVNKQKCLVILICHLNRTGKETDPPTNRSMYQPEYIRQADHVLMIYSKDLENHKITENKEDLVIKITKQRYGRLFRIPVYYKEATCTFFNAVKEL